MWNFAVESFDEVIEYYVRRLQEVFTSNDAINYKIPLDVVIHVLTNTHAEALKMGYGNRGNKIPNKGCGNDSEDDLDEVYDSDSDSDQDCDIFTSDHEMESGDDDINYASDSEIVTGADQINEELVESESDDPYHITANIAKQLHDLGLQIPVMTCEDGTELAFKTKPDGNCFFHAIIEVLMW